MIPVKICGITRVEDALAAAHAGAWAVGFIFYPGSPRLIAPERAKKIVEVLPSSIRKIGVVVDASLQEIDKISLLSGIDFFQLHGSESPDLVHRVRSKFEVIKAIRPKTDSELSVLSQYSGVDYFLIDAYVEGAFGGTGQRTKTRWVAPVKKFGKVGIAGGIRPDNAEMISQQSQADFLDLSSGVEDSPGIKNHEKIRELFAQLRSGGEK